MSELPTPYQTFIHCGHYARLRDDGTRETWPQTVDRYIRCIRKPGHASARKAASEPVPCGDYFDLGCEVENARRAILACEVMPSMRALMSAGPAAERNNIAMYNCAFVAIDSIKRFSEIMTVLMNGAGVGFSCETHVVAKLPAVPHRVQLSVVDPIIVEDSQEGWAGAFAQLLHQLWTYGAVPEIDYSKVRPAGAPLKTFGGRASGPGPLRQLFEYTDELLKGAQGRQLRPAEVHHLVCHTANVVVSGGVRRSALISLSSLDDAEVRDIKTPRVVGKDANGKAVVELPFSKAPWLTLSNNSAVYDGRPAPERFDAEWKALVDSYAGERGIFNRRGAVAHCVALPRPRTFPRPEEVGTNPCSEVLLRSAQFCNLSEVVIRAGDTVADVTRKVRLATVLGTFQACFTHFPGLGAEWRANCEDERLLGVSLTGICDNAFFSTPTPELAAALQYMRAEARATNARVAKLLGINESAAITCVKPSGTVSQLVDSASGIHPRWSQYYLRSVRISKRDPLYMFMRQAGVRCEDDLQKPDTTAVLYFPMAAPAGAKLRAHMTAVQQLELWLCYQRNWCEHKPSCTVYVRENEWPEVKAWVWKHFDSVSGVSFLPYDNGIYKQAPYAELASEAEYRKLADAMPMLDWRKLADIERAQTTHFTPGGRVWACSGDACELVDIQ